MTRQEKAQKVIDSMTAQIKKMVAEGRSYEEITAYNLQMLESLKNIR